MRRPTCRAPVRWHACRCLKVPRCDGARLRNCHSTCLTVIRHEIDYHPAGSTPSPDNEGIGARLSDLRSSGPRRGRALFNDFGLRTVLRDDTQLLLRGTGTAHFCYVVRHAPKARFVGFGLRVDSRADLEALASVPGASKVEASDWPGGGHRCVSPIRPVFGSMRLRARHGPIRCRIALRSRSTRSTRPYESTRRSGRRRAPEVIRLGHVVLETRKPARGTQHFGFIPAMSGAAGRLACGCIHAARSG